MSDSPSVPNLFERRFTSPEVCELLGWHRHTLRRQYQAGNFPQPEIVGNVKQYVWRESVLQDWLAKNTRTRQTNEGVQP